MQQTSTSSSDQSKSQIVEVLHETELGEFFLKHKTGVMAFVALVVFFMVGFGAYTYWHNQKIEEWSGQIFQFRSGTFKEYAEKKIDDNQFKKQFETLANNMKSEKVLLLPLIEASDALVKNGNKDMALSLLQTYGVGGVKKEPTAEYLIGTRVATLLEDMDKTDEAIVQLEKLLSSSQKIMEAKTVLDLGRLYLKKGDGQKAAAQFQFVIDNTAQADLVKLARLYKGQISQK